MRLYCVDRDLKSVVDHVHGKDRFDSTKVWKKQRKKKKILKKIKKNNFREKLEKGTYNPNILW